VIVVYPAFTCPQPRIRAAIAGASSHVTCLNGPSPSVSGAHPRRRAADEDHPPISPDEIIIG
jgi:hypothetical protein